VGAQPSLEVVAKGSDVVITRHPPGNAPADVSRQELSDPLQVPSSQHSCNSPTMSSSGSLLGFAASREAHPAVTRSLRCRCRSRSARPGGRTLTRSCPPCSLAAGLGTAATTPCDTGIQVSCSHSVLKCHPTCLLACLRLGPTSAMSAASTGSVISDLNAALGRRRLAASWCGSERNETDEKVCE
jgi:hypothetical protein